jgi:hypothetical protein
MNLVERVKNLVMTPKTEWLAIEQESGDPKYLFSNYVAILAAIPAIAGFIGTSLIGITVFGGVFRVPVLTGLVNAVLGYVLTFVGVYLMALIIDALAPTFGGVRNFSNAMKLAAYFPTPFWLAGVFMLIPALGILSLLGLYGLYLLWTGLAPLMKSPPDRSTGYAAAAIVCALVIAIVIGVIQAALLPVPRV